MVTADLTPLRAVLDKLGDKQAGSAAWEVKKGYAQRMSREIALRSPTACAGGIRVPT